MNKAKISKGSPGCRAASANADARIAVAASQLAISRRFTTPRRWMLFVLLLMIAGFALSAPKSAFAGASISASSLTLCGNQPETLTASLIGVGCAPSSYQWYVDNYPVPSANTYAYGATFSPGTHAVYCTIYTTSCGSYNSNTVNITDQSPNWNVTVTPSANPGGTCNAVQFSAQATTSCATSLTYSWNFGDGPAGVASSSATATHTYSAPGSFPVSVTVTDQYGNSINQGMSGQEVIGSCSLPAPTNLTATGSTTQIALSWTASAGAAGYNIYRGTGGSGSETGSPINGSTLVTGAFPAYADTSVSAGVTYTYYVVAVSGANTSPHSTEASASLLAPPMPPTNLVATPGDATVSLTWTPPVAPVISYTVKYSTVRGAEDSGTIVNNLTSPNYPVSNLVDGTTYYFVVTATNGAGTSVDSKEASAAPIVATAPPGGLTATANNQSVSLSWNNVAGATSYNLYYGTSSGVYGHVVTGLTLTSTTVGNLTNGTTYYFMVESQGNTLSGPSNEVPATPTLSAAAPTLTATARDGNVILSWRPFVGKVDYYTIEYGTSSGVYPSSYTGITSTSTEVPFLTDGTTYYFVVNATYQGATSANSNEAVATPIVAPVPSPPAGLTAVASDGKVTLSWSNSFWANSYKVYRSISLAGRETFLAPSTSQTYVDQGLTDGTRYYYEVTGINNTGESGYSNEANATPVAPAPVAPTSLTARAGNGQVTLSWNSSVGATSYNVYRGTAPGMETSTVVTYSSTSPTATDYNATNGVTYYYKVTALNSSGLSESGYSNEASATPLAPPPTAPVLTTAGVVNAINLGWSSVAGATGYKVYRGTAAGAETFLHEVDYESDYSDQAVTVGVTYYYKVTAFNSNGLSESGYSNEVNATPKIPAPAGLTATGGAGQVSLSWSSTPGATGYNIYHGITSSTVTVLIYSGANTNCLDTAVTNGTTYYYAVTAVNSGGEGPQSSPPASATPQVPIPAAPAGLTATGGAGQVSLSWSSTSGATGYNIYRGTSSSGEGSTPIAKNVQTLSYPDSGLTYSTTYYYQVTAINAGGEGQKSTEAHATTAAPVITINTATATPNSASTCTPVVFSAAATENYALGSLTYTWNFGDGSAPLTGSPVSHTYASAGPYQATLTVTDSIRTSAQQQVNVTVNAAAITINTANFNPNPALTCTPSVFTAAATENCPSGSLTYTWDFKDGSPLVVGTSATVPHQYTVSSATAGYPAGYPVSLTITDAANKLSSSTSIPVVVNVPTVTLSAFSASPSPALTCTPVTFTASASENCSPSSLTYIWNFGDGSPSVTTTIPTASHPYAAASPATGYTVTLTASDPAHSDTLNAATKTLTLQLVVNTPVITISSASVNPNPALTCNPVVGTASVSENCPSGSLTYAWNFGDGTPTVTGAAPTVPHQYTASSAAAGFPAGYPVQLTITDSLGNSAIKNFTVVVNVPTITINSTNATLNPATTCAPVVFSASVSENCSHLQALLNWNAVSGATSYNVYRGAAAGGPYSVIAYGVTGTSFADTNVTAGTVYHYATTALAPNQAESMFSGDASPALISTTPGTGLTYTWNFGDGSPPVTTATPTVSHPYTAASPPAGYLAQLTINDPTYGGNAIKTVSVFVAVPTITISSYSASPNPAVVSAPVAFTASASENCPSGSLTYSWNFGDGSSSSASTSPATTHPYATSSLAAGYASGYPAVLTVTDSFGGKTTQGINVVVSPPPAPSNLQAVAALNQINLTWTGVTGNATYNLYRSTTSGAEGTTPYQKGLTGSSYPDTGLADGSTYFYKLTAVVAGSESGPSNEATATVPDFVLSVNSNNLNITQASTQATTVTITPLNGYTGIVTLSLSGNPADPTGAGATYTGIAYSFYDPTTGNPCPGMLGTTTTIAVPVSGVTNVSLELCVDRAVPINTYSTIVSGSDTSPSPPHTAPLTVNVTAQTSMAVPYNLQSLHNAQSLLAGSAGGSAPRTLLDEVGRLAREVPAATLWQWKRELHVSSPAAGLPAHNQARLAALHLWLGEWELAHSQHPRLADWHFREAQRLSRPSDPVYGLAAYDTATSLFYAGAYQDAADTFRQLLNRNTALPGYDRRTAALWYRHSEAMAGYHAGRAAMGIPEPPRLDPLCAAAALASSLKSLSLPYDRATVLQACRVTGEGSNLGDVLAAGPKLNVTVRAITATDEGLIALPKPLVAYVEGDHFVSVVRADRQGVSYLCSDCGLWPGGQVSLTWKQWHALSPGIYAAVTVPHGFADQVLARALSPASNTGDRVASLSGVHGLRSPRTMALIRSASLLKGQVVRFDSPTGPVTCGAKLVGQRSSPFANGAHDGDPVNLATGEEEYTPTPDMVVYNPNGPPVVWTRVYNSYRGPEPGYEPADFGVGWSHPYNVSVYDANYDPGAAGYKVPTGPVTGSKSLIFDNGSRILFTASAVPSAGNPSVICTMTGQASPLRIEWDYLAGSSAGYFTVTFKDRTRWVTGPVNTNTGSYALSQVMDRTGNGLQLVYSSAPKAGVTYLNNPAVSSLCNWPVLVGIQDLKSHAPLLFIQRNSNRTITYVNDANGRYVYYQVTSHANKNVPCGYPQSSLELDAVSQITPGTSNPPARYSYGYQNYSNGDGVGGQYPEMTPFLATISRPSPTGTGLSTLTITYDPVKVFVSSVKDGNGNVRTYTDVGGARTQVAAMQGGQILLSYIVGYDSKLQNQISQSDGRGNIISTLAYNDPNYQFAPSSVTDGNSKTSTFTYDSFGNLQSSTTPRGTTTNYTWGYPAATNPGLPNSVVKANAFFMGELLSVQEGTKAKTSYDDYEEGDPGGNPPGLLHTITSPAANTIGPGVTTTTTYTYNSLGDVLTSVTPASATTGTITTKFNYTTDGTYSQPLPFLGQPLTISDNLGNTTHFRYDSQGNLVKTISSLGYETDFGDVNAQNGYNIANQPLLVTYPATGETGPGRAYATSTYLFPGGPLTAAQSFDESGSGLPVRQVKYALGQEGETLGVSGSTEPVTYTYDADYRLTTLTDGNSHVTRYLYNGFGYLDSVLYPGYTGPAPTYDLVNQVWANISGPDSEHYLYTPSSNQHVDGKGVPDFNEHVKRFIDGRGIERDMDYTDPENLPVTLSYPGGQLPTITNTYDPVYGRLTGTADGTVSKTFGYDDLDNVLSVKTSYAGGPQNVAQNYVYNPDSSLQTMSTPAGGFSYAYDGDGRPQYLTNPYSETSQWTYPDAAPVSTLTLGNGVKTTATMNPAGQLLDQTTKAGSTLLSEFGVPAANGYDSNGNLQSLTASVPAVPTYSGTTTYTYDNGQTANPLLRRDQLTAETSTRGGGYGESFAYDTAGNPTTFPTGGPGSASGTNVFNKDNQTSASGFTFDGAGNPTSYKSSVLVYDAENRLIGIPGLNWSAGYTADGLRAWKQNASGKTFFLYDGGDPVCELDSNGNVLATNTFGGSLLSRHTTATSASTFYTFDERGNTVQRLNASGSPVSTDLYDAWGYKSGAASSDPFGYQGADGDYTDAETGLLYLHARYYDPGTGRFVTRDPAGYGGGINLYSYARNNPVNSGDPSGLDPNADQAADPDHAPIGMSDAGYVASNAAALAPQSLHILPGDPARQSASDFARQIPGVGLVVMGYGAATGCDYIAGKHESATDRKWDAFGAVLSAIPYASRLRALARVAPEVECAAGSGMCFAADTPVLMDDNSHKPIQDVQPHDKVQTEDPDIGKTEVREVLSTSVRTAHDLVTVTTADAKTHKLVDTLTCTPEHPFRTDGGWVLAGNLAVGTSILTRAGPAVVVASVAKTHSDAGVAVYNFIVQDDHTYFVGNDEEWVHNGLYDCTNIAARILKKIKNGEVWNVTRPNGSEFPVGDVPGNVYHDVVRVGDQIIDQMTHGHSDPVDIEEWMRKFTTNASRGVPSTSRDFRQFFNFSPGSGNPSRFRRIMGR